MSTAFDVTRDQLPPHRALRGRRAAAVIVVAVLLGLAGCTPVDRISAKLVNGGIAFAVCHGTVVNEITVSARPADSSEQPTDLWHAMGVGELAGGEIVVYGIAPEGLVTDLGPTSHDFSGDEVSLVIENTGVRTMVWRGDGSQLSTDAWLTWTGARSDIPCLQE